MRQSPFFLAMLTLGAALPANAVYINEHQFVARGGQLDFLAADVPRVFDALRTTSREEQFNGVGSLDRCTATYLGSESFTGPIWVLTAAHCVENGALSRREDSLRFFDSSGLLLAGGFGSWVFVHPNRIAPPAGHGGASTDIALLRLPRLNLWGTLPADPILYDRDDELDKAVTFVGYGRIGVGNRDVSEYWNLWGGQRRASGQSVVDGIFEADHGINAGYHASGATLKWARTAAGDSGSAWWQQHDGEWTIIATTNGGNDGGSTGARVAKYASWIEDLFPRARRFSQRMRVTEASAFRSTNYALQAERGHVYFLVSEGQPGVIGPTQGIWTGARMPTMVTVPVRSATGETASVRLRASRSIGPCGLVRMEDGVGCGGLPSFGELNIEFHASDNPSLPSGAWEGTVALDAVGWHAPYRHRVEVDLDIMHGTRAQVTRHGVFESINYANLASRGTVYYLVPQQAGASGPSQPMALWGGAITHTTITVKARSAIDQRMVDLRLRATRGDGCSQRQMNDGVSCYSARQGALTVWYDPKDNTHLPAGLYRGVVHFQARGWHDQALNEAIRLDVNIDTLFQ